MPDYLINKTLFPEYEAAANFWRDKEFKRYVVVVTKGPAKKPTLRQEYYPMARNEERAIAWVKGESTVSLIGARFEIRYVMPSDIR